MKNLFKYLTKANEEVYPLLYLRKIFLGNVCPKLMKHIKRNMKKLIYLFAMLMPTSGICAEPEAAEVQYVSVEGVRYALAEDGVAEVKGYDFSSAGSSELVIPATVERGGLTYTVTVLGDECFQDNKKLQSVQLPSTVVKIGDRCFDNCISLTKVDFSEGLLTIGEQAFAGTALEKLEFPSTLVYVGDMAFMTCYNLKTVDLSHVRAIGSYAFIYCPLLTELTIPESVDIIGRGAFMDCGLRYLSLDFYDHVPLIDYSKVFGDTPIPYIILPKLSEQLLIPALAAPVYRDCPDLYYGRAVIDFEIQQGSTLSLIVDNKSDKRYTMDNRKSLLALIRNGGSQSEGDFEQTATFEVSTADGEKVNILYRDKEVSAIEHGSTFEINTGDAVSNGQDYPSPFPENILKIVSLAEVEEIKDNISETSLFDLNGRKIRESVPGQPYIHGGKTVLDPAMR